MDKEGLRKRKSVKSQPQPVVEKESRLEGVGLFWRLSQALMLSVLVLGGLLFYAYVTSPISSVVCEVQHDASKLKWAWSENKDLQNGRKLLTELHGPESIEVDEGGNWYTGLHGGRIVKITDAGKNTLSVVDITEKADFSKGSKRTGKRPLGLRLVGDNLYFADGYQGLFVIGVDTKKWEKIVGYDDVTPPMMFPDDLTITKDGKTVYLTDGSDRWQLHNLTYSILEGDCSGRIFKVDITSKRVETLRKGLCFPNGIELNPEETMLLVSESMAKRVVVMDTNSGETVKTVPFPGNCDNIRRRKSGGYWVAVPAVHDTGLEAIREYPFLRDIAAKILGSQGLSKLVNINEGMAVKLNEKFEPVGVHYDLEGKVAQFITEVKELDNGQLLLGSFIAHGIAKLDGLGLD